MSKKEEIKREEDWRAEDDMRTLIEYQKIMKDKGRKENAIQKLKERENQIKETIKDAE